ncbi:MAG: CAP domain-containing protein [Clostridia bacterium]|nr:CAP domain-containing protein [Clostridia bacterium]
MEKFSSKLIKIIIIVSLGLITAIVISFAIFAIILNSNKNGENHNIENEIQKTNKNTSQDSSIIQEAEENESNDSEEGFELNENENLDENNNQEINNVNEEEKSSNSDLNSSPIQNKNIEETNPKNEKDVEEEVVEEDNVQESVPDEDEGFNASTSELLSEANQLKIQNSSLIQNILQYTNEFREEANDEKINDVSDRSTLVLDSSLTTAACVRAIEIARGDEFSHTRPNGTSCFTVLSDMGISSTARAENIAECYSAESAASGWKNSAGHYKNMINPSFKKIGIGVIKYNGTYTWVQLFTN